MNKVTLMWRDEMMFLVQTNLKFKVIPKNSHDNAPDKKIQDLVPFLALNDSSAFFLNSISSLFCSASSASSL